MTQRVEIIPDSTGPLPPPPTPAPSTTIPAKFNGDVGKLSASYTELEAELSRIKGGKGLEAGDASKGVTPQGLDVPSPNASPTPGADGKGADPKADGSNPNDAAKKVVTDAGLDVSTYEAQFNATGDVAPDARKEIAEKLKGILGDSAETLVNQYIDGQKAAAVNNQSAIKDSAGGAEAYGVMVNWASTNLKPDEIAAFNTQVNSGNVTVAQFAVEALSSRFAKANGGREPRQYKGNPLPPGGGGATGFNSTAEMTAAMRDPRYKSDEAYRNSVASRIRASNANKK